MSEGSDWEVLATSATVEYFHTGILSNAVASSPSITEEAERQNRDDASETNSDRVVATSIFDSPPEELSVPLYLKGDPNKVVETVAVPRWLSDGEVWEVRLNEAGGAREAGRVHLTPAQTAAFSFSFCKAMKVF